MQEHTRNAICEAPILFALERPASPAGQPCDSIKVAKIRARRTFLISRDPSALLHPELIHAGEGVGPFGLI
jgi:hypothetical protein